MSLSTLRIDAGREEVEIPPVIPEGIRSNFEYYDFIVNIGDNAIPNEAVNFPMYGRSDYRDYFRGAIWGALEFNPRMKPYRNIISILYTHGWRIYRIDKWNEMINIGSAIYGRIIVFRFPDSRASSEIKIYEALSGMYTRDLKFIALLIEFDNDFYRKVLSPHSPILSEHITEIPKHTVKYEIVTEAPYEQILQTIAGEYEQVTSLRAYGRRRYVRYDI